MTSRFILPLNLPLFQVPILSQYDATLTFSGIVVPVYNMTLKYKCRIQYKRTTPRCSYQPKIQIMSGVRTTQR